VSPVHLGVGAVCAVAVFGLFLALETRQQPTDQQFVFANEFEDAKCIMNFSDGSTFHFSAKKDDRYERIFKAPKIGFIIMRCETASGTKEAPGLFHLVEGGGLTDAKFNPQGEIEARYYPGRRTE
jgi:hypothetical protein